MRRFSFVLLLLAFHASAFTAPATAAPEEMVTAIYDLDAEAVEDLVRDGEPVDEAYYRNVLEVAGIMSDSEPREVWWRARLMDITGTLANQSEPDEAMFDALKQALFPDAKGQAAMDLQRALNVFIATEGRQGGDRVDRQLELGADPMLRTARGNHPDMFGHLIGLAQQGREDAARMKTDTADLEQAVGYAWRALRAHAGASDKQLAYARAYLDAAMTPLGKPITFSDDSGTLHSVAAKTRVDATVMRTLFDEVFKDATDVDETDDAPAGKSLSWAHEYAKAIAE